MKQFLKDYFTFNKGDRNGILVLLFLLFGMLLFMTIRNAFVPADKQDYSSFDKLITELEAIKNSPNEESEIPNHYEKSSMPFPNETKNKFKKETKLFPFNPNNLPTEKWQELGLSEKQIRTLKNYESKGGKFYKKEDLKKIYGITKEQFEQLENYIQIPSKEVKFNHPDSDYSKNFSKKDLSESQTKVPLTAPIEINSADTAKLKNLKGIGSTFAKRILNYREKLGGFISFSQLYEIWGLDSLTVKEVIPQLSLNPLMVKKIDLNHCTISELKKHPYLNYNIANNIVLYRDQHGEYAKIQDLKQAVLVNEELFRKIAPYLTLD
jgi:competence protein ComEA